MFTLLEGIKNLKRAKLSAFIVTLTLSLALAVGGSFFLLTVKFQESSEFFNEAMELEVFLYDAVLENGIESLQSRFQNNPAVLGFVYISKDSAASIFKADTGEDIGSLVGGTNPLPASFRLRLKNEFLTQAKYDSLTAVFSEFPGVEEVLARRTFVFKLMQYRDFLWIGHIGVSIIVFLSSLILVMNIIKLSINQRQESIEIMKLVGAKMGFIRGPFLIEGAIIGIIGGTIGAGTALLMQQTIDYLLGIKISVPDYFLPAVFLTGILLSVCGSLLSLRRFLKVL